MRSPRLLAVAAASLVALAGCDKARPLPVPADPSAGCLSCHGGQESSTGAPPWSLPRDASGHIVASGNRYDSGAATTRIEVGAHTRHLARGVSCGACHVVPVMIASPGHNTGQRATVTFKELAAAGNVVPAAWVPATHTCANYCHGSSLNHGGSNHVPDWLGGTTGSCLTCHFGPGQAPPPQHPQGSGSAGFPDTTACAGCHRETVDAATGEINVTGGKHVNGQLDGGSGHPAGWADPASHGPAANAGLQGCAVCHGAAFDGGTSGVSCTTCHATSGHPSWQTECTFCHGSTSRAADATFPNVGAGVVVRANLASPPVGSQGETNSTAYAVGAHEAHVSPTRFANAMLCAECHGPTLPADVAHVNGTVVIGWGGTATHANVIPSPADGNLVRWNDASLPAGGANCTNYCHGASLDGGTHTSPKWNEGVAGASCGSCHALPPPYTTSHVPRQDCATCHTGYPSNPVAASTLAGAALATHVDGTVQFITLTCTTCHGSINAAPPNDITGATSGGNAIGAHQKHVALVTLHQGNFACTECHPDHTGNLRHASGAINILWGATATAGGYAVTPSSGSFTTGAAFPGCTNYCHNPRATDTAPGLVRTPTWTSAGTIICGSCHGLPPVGTGHTTSTACSGCHVGYANAPTAASTASAISQANHLNGSVNVSGGGLTCTSCHGDAARVPVASATDLDALGASLVKAAPPPDSSGLPSGNQVGAHLAHVNQGATAPALSNALRCVNCHLVPTVAPHPPASNPVAFGNLATAAGASPTPYSVASRNCSNTYCHGQFAGGRTGATVNWGTGTPAKLACNTCHGQGAGVGQPTYPHPQNTTCASCHAGYTATTVTAATHVDGLLNKSTAGCTACHGDRADTAVTLAVNTFKAAPGGTGAATDTDSTGATGTTANGVGAHRAHLVGAGGTPRWRSAAIACTECHLLPPSNADTAHATGVGTGVARATLTFGALAGDNSFETKTPSFTQPTCSNVYCHDPKSTDTAAGQVNAPGWTAATSAAQCGSCHGLPPAGTGHPSGASNCGSCHPGYTATQPTTASTIAQVNATSHINGQLDGGGGDCTGCHASAQPMAAGGTRRAIVPEFAQAWSHKRSAAGAVTKFDCVVCHMEGDPATGNPVAGVHQDGVINLRDPDTGTTIQGVTFNGGTPGAYTSSGASLTFTRFSRNLGSTVIEPAVAAIMINQCLKCHDADGAASPLARVAGGTNAKPFATTISGAGYVAGGNVSAGNVAGGVVNVNESFKTTNSSYHPVSGKQNNSYAAGTRMVAPWNGITKTAGTTTGWGYLISCWDCHALPTDNGIIVSTVTAHGGPATLRGNQIVSSPSATSRTDLCTKCHLGYLENTATNHGTGSAFATGGQSSMATYTRYSCAHCHGSGVPTAVVRPVRAQDAHGFNSLPAAGTKTGRWATGGVQGAPYAFMRNTAYLSNQSPANIQGTAYTPTCTRMSGSTGNCANSMGNYSAGGTY